MQRRVTERCPIYLVPSTLMRIVVIRFSSAGDIVCTTLALRRLREKFPDASIEYLTTSRFAGLLTTNNEIDLLHTLEDRATLQQAYRCARSLSEESIDLLIDLHNSLRSRLMRRFMRASRQLLLRKRLLRRIRRVSAPEVPVPLRYLDVLAPLGVSQQDGTLRFPIEGIDRVTSFPPDFSYVVIAPGARHATKRWPAQRFAEAACEIVQNRGEKGIAIIGGPDESQTCEEAERRVREIAPDLLVDNLCGRTSWPQTARVIADATIILSNDSVAGHLAAAVGTPVVSLFGSTVPAFGFAPHSEQARVVEHKELSCRPCTRIGRATCPKGDFRCMLEIESSSVVHSALELLADERNDQE